LRTAFLLLNAVDPEHLDNYGEYIRALVNRYGGDCWFIIYLADVRMRSEQFERVRRTLEEELATGSTHTSRITLDVARPWNAVFAAAIGSRDWWDDNVRETALLYLAKINTAASSVEDGTVQPGLNDHARWSAQTPIRSQGGQSVRGPDWNARTPPKTTRGDNRRSADEAELQAEQDASGKYIRNKKGVFICEGFTAGKCGKPGGECPKGFRHQCNVCLNGGHSGSEHVHPYASGGGKGGAKDKGGGKGKGKGGKKGAKK
jgi:hypothetical protein